ncbi:uncharacterized protein LOC126784049 [Argentina anserina]|uniref:uncharacterized protein LOC126784049 n=1 Tax=Argentina anserina TaxID=57926 RepID=UPI00217671DE|nr:uncharacterized protein LOC126784049 [Potentilla anserina]
MEDLSGCWLRLRKYCQNFISVRTSDEYSDYLHNWNGVIRSKNFIKEHHQRAIDSSNEGNDYTLLRDGVGQFYSKSRAYLLTPDPIGDRTGSHFQYSFMTYIELKRTRSLFLWNPTIARHIRITPWEDADGTLPLVHGVGYHSDEDDFKLLTLKELRVNCMELHVYSVGSSISKRVEKLPPKLNILPSQMGMVSLNNSRVAWLMKEEASTFVVTFDLIKEDYHAFPVPVEVGDKGELMVFGGSLAIWRNTDFYTDVWFTKDSHSWCMKVSTEKSCQPIFFMV